MKNNEMLKEMLVELDNHLCRTADFHWQLSEIFDWIDLVGYKRIHELKFFKTKKTKKLLSRYAINYCGLLIPRYKQEEMADLIPKSFFTMDRLNVDEGIVKSTVKSAMDMWIEMEKDNLEYYTDCWYKLIEGKHVGLACFVKDCLVSYSERKVKELTRFIMELKIEGYDIELIMRNQCKIHDHIRDNLMEKSVKF